MEFILVNLIFTGRNVVLAKVVFTRVCDSVHKGVCLSACWDTTLPRKEAPPWKEAHNQKEAQPPASIPWKETHHPPGKEAPQREGSTPLAYQHTVNEWPVCIPLECIIVGIIIMLFFILQKEYILMCDICGCLWILPVSNVHEVHDFIPAVSCSS